jgi:hypothetical protein
MLLMLALPLQALASASMLGCTFAHPATVAELAPSDAAMTAPCHEPEPTSAPATQHDCKHCASCALASALPIPAADVPAIVPAVSRYSVLSTRISAALFPTAPSGPPDPPSPESRAV